MIWGRRHNGCPQIALALCAVCMLTGCHTKEAALDRGAFGLAVIHEEEFGGAYLKLPIADFNELGFSYGDAVTVSFSNGYTLEHIPYYTGFYTQIGEPLLLAYPGNPYIKVQINCGDDLWETAGLTETDTANLVIAEKGAYLDVQEARDIRYEDDRSLYASDEIFANFRSVKAGDMAGNRLYRAASPCDNNHNRASYVDALTAEAGVQFILNLSDDEETLHAYLSEPDFDSPYFRSCYESGKVYSLTLDMNYTSGAFREKIAAGFSAMAEREGPYLVHCTEGKDRTGFVCMLLEMLCGAGYEELEADYMLTYDNYYGITRESDAEKYEMIVEDVFLPMVRFIAADEDAGLADLKKADFSECAKAYLLDAGMEGTQIERLRMNLCSTTESMSDSADEVVLGDEQFDAYIPLLEGKRVALFSNHTGIVGDMTSGIGELSEGEDASLIPFGEDANGEEITYGEHILDALIAHDVNVTAIFSPEHGFRGTEDAGATVDDAVDEKTGVPILSLYGDDDTHAPSEESMARFDTLVVDMQDVGLRYYTYYLSMYYLMDACASSGKEVIILDRPNPNGFYVDGPILRDEYKSNVGHLPIPVVYGLTWGELAQMINGEGWLAAGKDACDLTVIPCRNYTHQTKTRLIRNPSPNIKDMRAVYLYASTCFFENTAISVGRGTTFPFEVYGSPYLEGVSGFGFSFTPVSMSGASEPPFMDETCYGVDLRGISLPEIWENQINVNYLVEAYRAVHEKEPEVSFWGTKDDEGRYWIDKLMGTDAVRLQIEDGWSAKEIKALWQEEIEVFLEQRRPYLLYSE